MLHLAFVFFILLVYIIDEFIERWRLIVIEAIVISVHDDYVSVGIMFWYNRFYLLSSFSLILLFLNAVQFFLLLCSFLHIKSCFDGDLIGPFVS